MKILKSERFIIKDPIIEEQISYFSKPQRISFSADPTKNSYELEPKSKQIKSLYDDNLIEKEVLRSHVKMSSRNIYKLRLMQLYSNTWLSLNDLVNASLAFAFASELQIRNEPAEFKREEYDEFAKIISRTTRYFYENKSNPVKSVDLLDYSYFRLSLVSGMLWFLLQGKETISFTPRGRDTKTSVQNRVSDEIFYRSIGLSTFLDVNNYKNKKSFKKKLEEFLEKKAFRSNFASDCTLETWRLLIESNDFPYDLFTIFAKELRSDNFDILKGFKRLKDLTLKKEQQFDQKELDKLINFLKNKKALECVKELLIYRLNISEYFGIQASSN